MTNRLPLSLSLFAFAAAAHAQNISIAAASASTLSASVGTSQQVIPVAAGPLAASGYGGAAETDGAGTHALAELSWNSTVHPYSLDVYLDASAWVTGTAPAQADGGPHELIVTLSSPTPMPISLRLERYVGGTAGNPLPVARVDVNDDGAFELDDLSPPATDVFVLVGPTPVAIRCQLGAAVVGSGSVFSSLRLTGTPGNATAFPMLSGCIEAGYVVSPRFDGNLDFWVNSQHPGIAVAVFGLATQPLYLGSQAPGPFSPVLPCVLIPRPDLIVLLPSLAAETLVVPPVARPLMLYSQSVRLDSGVLATSRAFQIYEY